MARRYAKVAAGVAALVLAILVVLYIRGGEPVCAGQTLTYWLKLNGGLGSSDHVVHPGVRESTQAVRAIGTNAIPFLLKWIDYEPSAARTLVHTLAAKNLPPRTLGNGKVQSALGGPGHAHANAACTGFLLLGREAAPAIPELVRLSYRPRQSWTSTRALFALCNIGQTALPALEKILTDPQHPNRELASEAIGMMMAWGADVSRSIPALKRASEDPDESVASAARKTLELILKATTPAQAK